MLAHFTFETNFLKSCVQLLEPWTCINVIVNNVNVEDNPKSVFLTFLKAVGDDFVLTNHLPPLHKDL